MFFDDIDVVVCVTELISKVISKAKLSSQESKFSTNYFNPLVHELIFLLYNLYDRYGNSNKILSIQYRPI